MDGEENDGPNGRAPEPGRRRITALQGRVCSLMRMHETLIFHENDERMNRKEEGEFFIRNVSPGWLEI